MKQINRKSMAREIAMQCLYQWEITQNPIEEIKNQALANPEHSNFSKIFFEKLILGIIHNIDEVDKNLFPCLDRDINRLDMVERAILRLAVFEILHCPESPTKVIINEAVSLSKIFAGDDSYKYINAVLDKLSKTANRTAKIFTNL